jgi:hypothetical protein
MAFAYFCSKKTPQSHATDEVRQADCYLMMSVEADLVLVVGLVFY